MHPYYLSSPSNFAIVDVIPAFVTILPASVQHDFQMQASTQGDILTCDEKKKALCIKRNYIYDGFFIGVNASYSP